MSTKQHQTPQATSIWKAKDDKHAGTAASKNTAASSKKDTVPSSKNQSRSDQRKKAEKPKMQYQPKLMTEEDIEKKTILIKISMRTSTRQVINFAIEKIRKDWTVTFNAFQVDLCKALQACEIIKTRVPFLYQENKFISWEVPAKENQQEAAEGEEAPAEEAKKKTIQRVRTGISITLSKVQFDITNPAGYQKPKPRQFLQPLPTKPKVVAREESDEEKLSKRKRRGKNRPRSADKPSKPQKIEDNKEKENPRDNKRRPRRNNKIKDVRDDDRSHSDDRRRHSSHDDYRDVYRSPPKGARGGYYPPYHDEIHHRFDRRGPHSSKNFDSDFEKPRSGGYGRMMHRPDNERFHDYRPPSKMGPSRYGGPPSMPFRERPPRNGPLPHTRGGYPPYGPPRSKGRDSDFDKPDRPGYYAGSRPFRMDKMRDEPLEKEERTGGPSGRQLRDQRNKPSNFERR